MLYMGSRLFTYYFRRRRFLKIYIIYVILTPLALDLWRIPRNLDSNGPIISEKMIENGDKTPANQGACLYYKPTDEPEGSGVLKQINNKYHCLKTVICLFFHWSLYNNQFFPSTVCVNCWNKGRQLCICYIGELTWVVNSYEIYDTSLWRVS